MADQGLKIVEKDGVCHLSGMLNEYADMGVLLKHPEPLQLDLQGISRLNSIGIRNFLKFLAEWGAKGLVYDRCPSEFIDQINMIPALLGTKAHAKIKSLFVPYECVQCDTEEDVLGQLEDYRQALKAGELPKSKCSKCGTEMSVLTDSFFVFLGR